SASVNGITAQVTLYQSASVNGITAQVTLYQSASVNGITAQVTLYQSASVNGITAQVTLYQSASVNGITAQVTLYQSASVNGITAQVTLYQSASVNGITAQVTLYQSASVNGITKQVTLDKSASVNGITAQVTLYQSASVNGITAQVTLYQSASVNGITAQVTLYQSASVNGITAQVTLYQSASVNGITAQVTLYQSASVNGITAQSEMDSLFLTVYSHGICHLRSNTDAANASGSALRVTYSVDRRGLEDMEITDTLLISATVNLQQFVMMRADLLLQVFSGLDQFVLLKGRRFIVRLEILQLLLSLLDSLLAPPLSHTKLLLWTERFKMITDTLLISATVNLQQFVMMRADLLLQVSRGIDQLVSLSKANFIVKFECNSEQEEQLGVLSSSVPPPF
ncbi:hypothetical protein JZ751_007631, partial [Albula glossodonta]